MILLHVQRTRVLVLGLVALLFLCANTARAQIVNSSFEEDGQFSLKGWHATDPSCQEAVDTPAPGGGTWALKLQRRNLQGGCFGVVYQVLPEVQTGGAWRVTAWVRVPPGAGPARLYWTNFEPADPSGVLPYMPAPYDVIATATSDEWAVIALVDTLTIAAGDSIGIVLDAGLTSGPTTTSDFAYFDLIAVDQPGGQDIAANNDEQPDAPAFGFAHNFPNPFQAATTISFTLNRADFVTLDIYDLLGRKVDTLVADQLTSGTHSAIWEANDLPDGLYVGQLRSGAHVRTIKLVRLR